MIKFFGLFVILTVTSKPTSNDQPNEVQLERNKRQSDMYYQQPQMYDDYQDYGQEDMSTVDEYGNRLLDHRRELIGRGDIVCIGCVIVRTPRNCPMCPEKVCPKCKKCPKRKRRVNMASCWPIFGLFVILTITSLANKR